MNWGPEVEFVFRVSITDDVPSLLEQLAAIVRKLRVAAREGRCPHLADEIVFRIRPKEADPEKTEAESPKPVEWLDSETTRLVLDDEAAPAGNSIRLAASVSELPRVGTTRQKLVGLYGVSIPNKTIAALSILLQDHGYFEQAFEADHSTPKDVLNKEMGALRGSSRDVGIARPTRGRPARR